VRTNDAVRTKGSDPTEWSKENNLNWDVAPFLFMYSVWCTLPEKQNW
jgi:hypothetical protein